jgi:hypothetical protein
MNLVRRFCGLCWRKLTTLIMISSRKQMRVKLQCRLLNIVLAKVVKYTMNTNKVTKPTSKVSKPSQSCLLRANTIRPLGLI